MKTFQAPATLTSVSSTSDGGLRLNFHTQELSVEDKVTAMQFHQTFGYVLFRANQFAESEVPDTDAPSDEERTPSQRLRAAIYVWWIQQGEKGDFDAFYREHMEKAINRVKRVLD